ncbi:hypothetical protein RvY_05275-2 [Ramazzottius varieornatus]|uniref:Gamma-interferon-inducible lysosomal thiol reductase n=1 Tax=Ramazzottius varieornatus TaxID=947166 RepID=A0A1D1UUI0_RAMVA|nr:hypothetical protein RvY_05275-2 [Ramazzottius varieornatus]
MLLASRTRCISCYFPPFFFSSLSETDHRQSRRWLLLCRVHFEPLINSIPHQCPHNDLWSMQPVSPSVICVLNMSANRRLMDVLLACVLLVNVICSHGHPVDNSPLDLSRAPTTAAPVVSLEIYYETLCIDSVQFIVGQLHPTLQKIGHIVNVSMIPFGIASVSTAFIVLPSGLTTNYRCHNEHGSGRD